MRGRDQAKARLSRKKLSFIWLYVFFTFNSFLRIQVILKFCKRWASNENCEMIYAYMPYKGTEKLRNMYFFSLKSLFACSKYTVTFSVINCFHSRGHLTRSSFPNLNIFTTEFWAVFAIRKAFSCIFKIIKKIRRKVLHSEYPPAWHSSVAKFWLRMFILFIRIYNFCVIIDVFIILLYQNFRNNI
jgi:hypothetical protein